MGWMQGGLQLRQLSDELFGLNRTFLNQRPPVIVGPPGCGMTNKDCLGSH
jgi:hypothetical protein